MSAILDCALALAQQKVRFFPVQPNSKIPAVANFSSKATSDPEQLTEMFNGGRPYNSGIACGKVAEGLYLVGFDIDNKSGRNGYETLELMAELGEEFPDTWSQKTPSGGEHRLFWSPIPIRQGANTCGAGIDLRGDGGYLVGPGSVLNGVYYHVIRNLPIAKFPDFAIKRWEKKATVHNLQVFSKSEPVENQIFALKQAVTYLQSLDTATEGGRSHSLYKVCAQLKDYGVDKSQIFDVLLEHWKCEPLLSAEEIHAHINNAFKYTQTPPGIKAPEKLFPPAEDVPADPLEKTPIQKMNEDHFYYAANGHTRVCWETTKAGKFHLERYPVYAFHEKYSKLKMMHNGKQSKVTQVWMESEERRQYDWLRFHPGNNLSPNEYNTWRGFAVKPADVIDPLAIAAVKAFKEHCLENICGNDPEIFKWVFTFMAHIFQKPEEKPEVSLVLRGEKGTGKTIISEILGHLIGSHAVILTDKNHVLGHFNSIMEDKLLVTLDEAFWSGDKQIEGSLKGIITGRERVITHKGAEGYKADVFDRIIIIGNERWMVPSSGFERRFTVLDVGDKRRQDRKFFGAMKEGIFKRGGDALLMKEFLAWDLSQADIGVCLQTEALDEQKRSSLGPFQQWWLQCLLEGQILGSGLESWPETIPVTDFYAAFKNQYEAEGNRAYKPTAIGVGMLFRYQSPSSGGSQRINEKRYYKLAPLKECREEWTAKEGTPKTWV